VRVGGRAGQTAKANGWLREAGAVSVEKIERLVAQEGVWGERFLREPSSRARRDRAVWGSTAD
jgi:hypothetical protein